MKKINQLISRWPKGTVGTTDFLISVGYQKNLLLSYVKSGWLESIGNGAYKLANDNIEWYGALYALQTHKRLSIHAGGKTALELKGFAHYLPQRETHTELFGNTNETLPKWFENQSWSNNIRYYRTNLFADTGDLLSETSISSIEIKISPPELAMMEMLYLVPKVHSFDEANLIMESLTTLRSTIVHELLQKCNSIKVKRMFLYLSEKNNHSWFHELELTNIDTGSGKRVIVKNGKLNKKYNITVPRHYDEE